MIDVWTEYLNGRSIYVFSRDEISTETERRNEREKRCLPHRQFGVFLEMQFFIFVSFSLLFGIGAG